ncbi:MAG: SCO1664 family protein [Nocardioides sp.]|uniref:SCO1664 family protein n=1 Tax=Nocardioides sp. TaxID=35761 RepID=UPI003F085A42
MIPEEAVPTARDVPTGELEIEGRVMPASNATFVGSLAGVRVVYKPVAGERPLWDFPDGTLAGREVAAHLLSEALGWDVVPQTWLADGPHGPGMFQRWCEPVPEGAAVDLVPAGTDVPGFLAVLEGLDGRERPVSLVHEDTAALRRMALFDVVVNNADRKGGHVLTMPDGHRFGVDHGLTFHAEPKLRTVLWGWAGHPLDQDELDGLARLVPALEGPLAESLADHVTELEIEATLERLAVLLARGTFPLPGEHWPQVPWPPF